MTTRVHHVLKARKNNKAAGIKKGDSYYWWKFRFGGKHFSKTPPARSQLTQSEWLGQAYDLDDQLQELTIDTEGIASTVEDIASQARDLAEQCQERLDAMPEALQESSSSGQTLQEYIDQFEEWADTLEGIDWPDGDAPEEPEDPGEEPDPEDFEDEDEYQEALKEYETLKDIEENSNYDDWKEEMESALSEAQSSCPF